MTNENIKEIERVFQKPIHEVEEIDIPALIRKIDLENEMYLINHLKRGAEVLENIN